MKIVNCGDFIPFTGTTPGAARVLDIGRELCYNMVEMIKQSNGGGKMAKTFTLQETGVSLTLIEIVSLCGATYFKNEG